MKIRQIIVGMMVAVATLTGLSIATVTPAQAKTTYIYPIYQYQVCQRQGHYGASFTNPWNPYSWYCYDMSFPLGVTWAGSLDLNGWCKAKYRDTHAELMYKRMVWDWRCVKTV